MDDALALLHTKFTPPAAHAPIVSRPALLARLDLALQHDLCLLSAPAGSGKTTLVAEWLSDWHPELPAVAWVTLDPGDNDPRRFWRYVFTALQAVDLEASRAALDRLHSAQQPDAPALLIPLINDLASTSAAGLLALEDYHLITNPQVHDGLAFLLDHHSPGLRLLILTRSDPPLPLARLRARNQVAELRAADLRFSLTETADFLQAAVPHALAPGIAERLAERTEGWVAGLRLAALALRARPDPAGQQVFLDTFTGSHRPLLDYLAADVLAAQPEPLQSFLLETSQLDRLCAPLCDAVLASNSLPVDAGLPGRVPASRRPPAPPSLSPAVPLASHLLEQLERRNLFLEPLDGAGQWYRYHPLFAEAMRSIARQRLGEAHLRRLAARAAGWYAANDMPGEAVEAALLADDFACAARLIERVSSPRLVGNEYHTLLRWIEALPEDVLRCYPGLCLTCAQALLFTTQADAAPPFDRMQALLDMAEDGAPIPGAVDALRALIIWRQGNYPAAFTAAHRALALLPPAALEWRGISLIFTAWESYYAGHLTAALQALVEARALFQAAGNTYGLLNAILALGEVHSRRAEPQQAGELFHQALRELKTAPINQHDARQRRGRALLGLATLAYERNDLPAAEDSAAQALEIAGQLTEQDLLAHTTCLLARLDWAAGRLEAGRSRLSALAARLKSPLLLRQVYACQARLALAAGDQAFVQRWVAVQGQPVPHLPTLLQEQEALILARIHIAQGRPAEALPLLQTWLAAAHADGRTRSELEAHLLLALAYASNHQWETAAISLSGALALAAPQDYLRLYLDEGAPLDALLRAVAKDQPSGAASACLRLLRQARCPSCSSSITVTGRAILDDLPFETGSPPSDRRSPGDHRSPGDRLPSGEMLSLQEGRVLGLLADGLSNPEIAQELVVSVNTVKTHLKSIYRKLQVNDRRNARRLARRIQPHAYPPQRV